MTGFISKEKQLQLKNTAEALKQNYMDDITIAQRFACEPIEQIADKLGIDRKDVEPYGKNKAKIAANGYKDSKLVLVTAINPTPAGEGKTTTSIGLADALALKGTKVCAALREPSLGPVFGLKGGATGGGLSQIIPMEDINLHFTGDMHAITAATNLLSALIDNHIYQGNKLNLDKDRILWRRAMDTNDRALRSIEVACGEGNGTRRTDGFNITAASEIMAMLCLAKDLNGLKERFGNIAVGFDKSGRLVYARELEAQDAMAILMQEAIKPNLVQTLAGTPVIVHGGPFANIAHGCNSIIATKTAMRYADVVVTEAGFGADLGAEKFIDVKCRIGGLNPDAVVIVATARALKMHGGALKQDLAKEDLTSLKAGLPNLEKHIENVLNKFNLPCVVAINKFTTDTAKEIELIKQACKKYNVKATETEVWAKGGFGAEELADDVLNLINQPRRKVKFIYQDDDSIAVKTEKICKEIYGGKGVEFSPQAQEQIKDIESLGYGKLPVVIAKTQYSLSDDAAKLARPTDFTVKIREVQLRSGSGFIVAVAGNIMLMPGLPQVPAANNMKISEEGVISGLF
jgi:formate--tetrahydrofolate ligase